MKTAILFAFISLGRALEAQQGDIEATVHQVCWWILVVLTACAALGIAVVVIGIVRAARACRRAQGRARRGQ
jgi:heme/copper-type cytochrome/quinol oxidase subunit 2